ncbi:MAG TPA: hydroxysqualene dehydroxylase HpnE [Isosphaeraceae bacterium]
MPRPGFRTRRTMTSPEESTRLTAPFKPPAPHVVIVGGGLAGLATAAALVGHGLRITLLESRPRLGGRASSFVDPATGEHVDNCQHVSMACCTNLADFCRRVGTADLFRREPAVLFLDEQGRLSPLGAGRLPAPFHLAGGFLRARYLTWAEKLRVGYGLARLVRDRAGRPGETFAAWLLRHGQTPRTVERFWATVLVSALNERLDRMDVGHARKVFLDGFLRNRAGAAMEVPLVPLGELYGTRLERWLGEHGVDVRLTTGVRSVDLDAEGSACGVTLRSGEVLAADFVVAAVPFDRVAGILPEGARARIAGLAHLEQFQSSPITGVHLWFDRPVCPFDHAVVVGRLIQWVFNHTALQGRVGPSGAGQYLQLVISASYDLLGLDKAAILAAVRADLARIWPATDEANLRRWWVVTEHGATFSVRPGIDALRPAQHTEVEGLFLAGDWTATGWPATMEGAVRSGYLAAEGVLADLGRPARLLRPGLRAAPLARLLLGPPDPERPPVPALAATPRPTPLPR